ncbi:MAG TPA: nitrilase-related carbon-nitrogen hydrolase [Cyclobacteriaceae bacterium]|nr:nitrilase-related carbon-nitrogen hydrolase [Cyclobacteriaceae bacterium]
MTRVVLIAVTLLFLSWGLWCKMGRLPEHHSPALVLDVVESLGDSTRCNKNIVGIQPFMVVEDYLSAEAFESKMDGYFNRAQAAGYLHENTVVLLPEYLGTWLLLAGEKNMLARQETMNAAMPWLIFSNPFRFLSSWWNVDQGQDHLTVALFRMKAKEMAQSYHQTFKHLAIHYHTTIVAGSILLPGPKVIDDSVVVDDTRPLYNASFVFMPDGRVAASPVRKVFPTREELPFIASAPVSELPVFDLPIGRTAVLVCADSWYPAVYEEALRKSAEVVLVPSYCPGTGSMDKPWLGYSGNEPPEDVSLADVGKITEGQAWSAYALEGRLHRAGASVAANVFLRGRLWDLHSDGQSVFMLHGKKVATRISQRAGIWNLCW